MKITVNGKEFTDGFNSDGQPLALQGKPRLKWSDIGRMGGLYFGRDENHPQRMTSKSLIRVTVPGEDKPREHVHGWSLIVVDGMSITVRAKG
jgi:hypothetical protein